MINKKKPAYIFNREHKTTFGITFISNAHNLRKESLRQTGYCAHKTLLLFIEVSVQSHESEWSCIVCYWYRVCISLRLFYLILEVFRRCGILFIFYFHFDINSKGPKYSKCVVIATQT